MERLVIAHYLKTAMKRCSCISGRLGSALFLLLLSVDIIFTHISSIS